MYNPTSLHIYLLYYTRFIKNNRNALIFIYIYIIVKLNSSRLIFQMIFLFLYLSICKYLCAAACVYVIFMYYRIIYMFIYFYIIYCIRRRRVKYICTIVFSCYMYKQPHNNIEKTIKPSFLLFNSAF